MVSDFEDVLLRVATQTSKRSISQHTYPEMPEHSETRTESPLSLRCAHHSPLSEPDRAHN